VTGRFEAIAGAHDSDNLARQPRTQVWHWAHNERDAHDECDRRDTESTMMGVEMMGDHMRGGGRFGDTDDDLSWDMIPSAEVGPTRLPVS
jgi:hypothetical protein